MVAVVHAPGLPVTLADVGLVTHTVEVVQQNLARRLTVVCVRDGHRDVATIHRHALGMGTAMSLQ